MATLRTALGAFGGDDAALAGRLRDAAGLERARVGCRDELADARDAWRAADALRRRVTAHAQLSVPLLAAALPRHGCRLFLRLLEQAWQRLGLGPWPPRGCTLLAPDDGAFLGDVANWEDACWPLHVVEVPLRVGDMANYPGGRVRTRHFRCHRRRF
jgi:hypothetical protein